MVELQPPEFVSSGCYTSEAFRHVFASIVCVEGVVDRVGGDMAVTAAGGASVDVSVAAGDAWILGDLNNAEGAYHVTNDTAKAVTIAANGAGSARIDLIIASVYDSEYIGAVDQWAIEVVQGVAGGGTPVVPDGTKSGYIVLGSVSVPASGGTPSVVTDVRQAMSTCGHYPYVDLRASASTSVPHNTAVVIALTTTTHIDNDFYTVASSVVTILKDGLYDIAGFVSYATSTVDAEFDVGIGKNGASSGGLHNFYVANVKTASGSAGALGYFLTAGTTIQLAGYQFQASGALAVATRHTADAISRLMIRKVG